MEFELNVDGGTALAASPDLLDPNFMHRVVLMGQHTAEGAYGLVVNHASHQTTSSVFPDHPTLSTTNFPVHIGGPVELSALQILHCIPEVIPGGVPLLNDLYIGGDLDVVGEYLHSDPDAAQQEVRLVVGYSGWGAGQLEQELASGSWLPASIKAVDVFETDPDELWRRVLRSVEGGPGGLENQPPDPTWN